MKYILENWVNGDYVANHLRPITRENKKYLISDVQRTVRSYDKEPREYVFVYKWATKYFKDNSELGFRRSVTRRCNTDGIMTYAVSKEPSVFKCPYTFEQVFGNDLREIQDPGDAPLCYMLNMANLKEKYTISLHKEELPGSRISDWDIKIREYLKELFKVKEIYTIGFHKISENNKQTILSKSGTLFQLNIFGGVENESILFKDNYFNRTILYWLFDDRLVYQYEDGKNTW